MGDNQDTWPAGQTATMNVTYTQANAAGGAVVCEITPGPGNEFILLDCYTKNSGTNGVQVSKQPGGAGTIPLLALGTVASGVATSGYINVGSVTTAAATTTAVAAGVGYPNIFSGIQSLKVQQTGAGAQNDTFQVLVNIRVKTGQMPTVTHANSTNAANVSVTAGAESFTTV